MENQDNIELRSEKIRHIIGRVPPVLIRSGIGVISGIVFLLIIAACYIPYPEAVSVPVKIVNTTRENNGLARAVIPFARITEIKPGMKVEMQMEGYNADTYGYVEGSVNRIDKKVIPSPSGDCFTVDIVFRQPSGFSVVMNQQGTASICLSNGSLAERIFRNSGIAKE